MNYPSDVEKYLAKYGLDLWKLEPAFGRSFNNIIVIPAIDEFENIPPLLHSLLLNDPEYFSGTLVIIIVNNLKSSDERVKNNNEKSLNYIRSLISRTEKTELAEKIYSSGLSLGLIDASGPGLELPEKEGGVGLARKIGMDLALRQFDYSKNSPKILICLDADCTVDSNYLSAIAAAFKNPDTHAAYVQYEHQLPGAEPGRSAIICYEIFLRYYLIGLKYADSPFAFPTIGSTMISDYSSYIKIGGMNRKKAAEDFYFMEKLAKVTRIKKIESAKVYPSSRGSWRVPFGTGQRVNRFSAGTHEEYLLYNPASFTILKQWLRIFNQAGYYTAEEYLDRAGSIDNSLRNFLLQNEFAGSWTRIVRSSKSDLQIEKQKLLWFDGFRTLRLIHFLRDNGYPQVNMFDALDEMLGNLNIENIIRERREKNIIPPPEIQIQYLNLLRSIV